MSVVSPLVILFYGLLFIAIVERSMSCVNSIEATAGDRLGCGRGRRGGKSPNAVLNFSGDVIDDTYAPFSPPSWFGNGGI